MKTFVFLIIVLISGAFAGTIHGVVNFAIVEPYLDQAIGIENQNLFASGEEKDTPEFWVEYEGYRVWQKKWPDSCGGYFRNINWSYRKTIFS